uniref:Tick transposon n=1 Tax=Rhipicephalus pulchellus TaxID=72859 RepID=L7M003_RHIPC
MKVNQLIKSASCLFNQKLTTSDGVSLARTSRVLLAINRSISRQVDQEGRERCLLEGVEALNKTVTTRPTKNAKDPTKRVVTFFKQNNLRLIQADKNGEFVVLREDDFKKRAEEAIAKNFVRVRPSATRVKGKAAAMCKDLELSKLASSITRCKKKALTVFFTAKTHKDKVPFRTIVSEKGSWQCLIIQFLQKHLSALHVEDPFATKNSGELVSFLSSRVRVRCAFSIDVEDLF